MISFNTSDDIEEDFLEDEVYSNNSNENSLFNIDFSENIAVHTKEDSRTTRNTKRVSRRELAKMLKLRMEKNTENTLPLESYKTILSELFHVMGEAMLHGNDICIYPIGVISTHSRFGDLYNDNESIPDWFFVHSQITLTSNFRKKLRLYMLSRQAREDIDKFKDALYIAQETDFKISKYRINNINV